MKFKLIYILLTTILLLILYLMRNQIISLFFSSKEKQSVESIAKKYSSKVEISLKNAFKKTNIDSTDFEMGILAFKKEQIPVERKGRNKRKKIHSQKKLR